MGSTVKELGALDANEQHSARQHGHTSRPEKRSPNGAGTGEWLVNVAGDVVVPMSTTEIIDGLRANKLSERSLVWRLGMQDWIVIGEVPQLRLAAGTASAPPPASGRVAHARSEAEREPARRSTLPHGFPVARDPASVRKPVGLHAPAPLGTPPSAARAEPPRSRNDDDGALAVYDRPAASLTFSDSVHAEWRGESQLVTQPAVPLRAPAVAAQKHTPQPVAPTRFSQPARSGLPNSLMPTTSDVENGSDSGQREQTDSSVERASDFRAARASTKHVTWWAAFGSAVAASALTLWLVRSPALEAHAPVPTQPAAAQPVATPNAPLTPEHPASSASTTAIALPAKAATLRPSKVAPRPRATPVPQASLVPQVEPPVTASEPDPWENPYGAGPGEPGPPRAAASAESGPRSNPASEPRPAAPSHPTETAPGPAGDAPSVP